MVAARSRGAALLGVVLAAGAVLAVVGVVVFELRGQAAAVRMGMDRQRALGAASARIEALRRNAISLEPVERPFDTGAPDLAGTERIETREPRLLAVHVEVRVRRSHARVQLETWIAR